MAEVAYSQTKIIIFIIIVIISFNFSFLILPFIGIMKHFIYCITLFDKTL